MAAGHKVMQHDVLYITVWSLKGTVWTPRKKKSKRNGHRFSSMFRLCSAYSLLLYASLAWYCQLTVWFPRGCSQSAMGAWALEHPHSWHPWLSVETSAEIQNTKINNTNYEIKPEKKGKKETCKKALLLIKKSRTLYMCCVYFDFPLKRFHHRLEAE